MKNLLKLIGIIALAAVIGFSMTACGGGDDGDNGGTGSGGGTGGGGGGSGETVKGSFNANAGNSYTSLSSPVNYQVVDLTGENRTDVLKVTNPGEWAVALYDLTSYKGQNITITFSVEVKRVGAAGTLNWQVNNSDYPSVGTPINNAAAGTWHSMSGTWTGTPSDNNPKVYLSTYENNSASTTYYIDNFTITVTITGGSGTAPTITTASLPNGTVGTAYNQTLTATGTTPITWSLESGSLPAGLNISGSAITGTPTSAGTATFTVKATNAKGYNTKQLSITIAASGGGDNNLSSAWFEPIGNLSPVTEYQVINGGTPPNQVVIPATYNGLPITRIKKNAFKNCTNITSVTIGSNINTIGESAFSDCTNLTSIILPSGITSIYGYAFWNCTKLTSVTFNCINSGGMLFINIYTFLGDLQDKYLAGGTGTYTTTAPVGSSSVWTKQ